MKRKHRISELQADLRDMLAGVLVNREPDEREYQVPAGEDIITVKVSLSIGAREQELQA
jgi:hypothetical protein